MKHSLVTLTLLAAAPAALASPFTLRMVPAGYSAKVVSGSGGTQFFSPPPVVVDIGWGRRVWYGGGLNFSTFPYAPNPLDPQFTLPLPAIGIAGFPGVTERPQSGVVCDVDRDGDMDLLRINSWNGWDDKDTFQVFLNQGSGSFTPGYRLDTTVVLADSIARHFHIDCADFDRDGDPDVAILMAPDEVNRTTDPWHYDGTLTVRWNDGLGAFPTSTVLRGTGFNDYAAMSVADLDRDGDADILCDGQAVDAGGGFSNYLTMRFTNSGSGTFTMTTQEELPARLADFNNDGWMDAGSRESIRLNDGAGHIGSLPLNSDFPGSGVKDHAYADADGDGIIDYILNQGSNLMYRKGNPTGIYGSAVPLATLPSPAAAIGAGDSDGDGDTDLMLHLNNGTFAFLENRSLHQEAGATLAGSVSVPGVTQLHAADFDRDGREDLLAVAPSQKKLHVLFGEADGSPSAGVVLRSLASAPHSAAVADFDLDGRTDVAYTVPGTGEVRMARNQAGLLLSWPDSAIATSLPGVALLEKGVLGTPIGRTDLLTGNATTGQLHWLNQSAAGAWSGQTVLSSYALPPGSIMAADAVNRPGDEVFYLAADETTMFLRGSQLNPTWVPLGTNFATPVSTAPLAQVMAWADVTGDQRNEIVFVRGDGALAFWNLLTSSGGAIGAADSDIRAITTVDWDRDGRTDILCATGNGVSLFTWKGAWVHKKLYQSTACNSITTINLNHDGWMDAAVGDSATGVVTFLTNTPRALVAVHTSPSQVTILNAQTGTAASFNATSVGELADTTAGSLTDVNAVVSGVDVHFYRAIANGSAWEKGPALTVGELSQAVSSITLVRSGSVIGSASAASLAGGKVPVSYVAGSGTLSPITPGSTAGLSIRLTATAGASQSAFSRFFVQFGSSLRGYPDDGISGERPMPLTAIQPVLVSITPALTPLQQWRQTNLGNWQSTGTAANDADPDGDGVANLMEYLSGQSPTVHNGSGASSVVNISRDFGLDTMVAELRLLTTYDSKVKLTLQYSHNPATAWSQLSTRTGTGAWTGITPYITTLLSGGNHTRFVFDGGFNPTIFKKTFFRLKAEELP